MRKGVKDDIKVKCPGPKKGQYTPVQDRIRDDVIATKMQYGCLGAAKIGVISKVDASAPTVHKVLKSAGFENVTMRSGKVYKSFEMDNVNDMWQIDYVELGVDTVTSRKVEFLSVIDDKSRCILSDVPTLHATTDDVIAVLEDCVKKYGCPKAILSDHGTQWAVTNGGDARFDIWCESHGIKHIMGKVRKPTTQGKVERWHGSIRREAGLPKEAPLLCYEAMMRNYVAFYNEIRPHWSCGLETPFKTYLMGLEALQGPPPLVA